METNCQSVGFLVKTYILCSNIICEYIPHVNQNRLYRYLVNATMQCITESILYVHKMNNLTYILDVVSYFRHCSVSISDEVAACRCANYSTTYRCFRNMAIIIMPTNRRQINSTINSTAANQSTNIFLSSQHWW